MTMYFQLIIGQQQICSHKYFALYKASEGVYKELLISPLAVFVAL